MRCVRPGCPGSYGADGYCDECGRKAPASATAVPKQASTATTPSVATVSASGRTTPSSGRSRGSSRGGLGAGLIDLPRVPLRDPATAVMTDPKVSESRRFCVKCEEPVGRGKDGKPGRVEGFCPNCGHAFSFVPRLGSGDVVNDRYEVLGALAYGGLGWIYLARDRNLADSVSDRWVVLKGLINTGDADAMAAAVTERRYLVEIDHPSIVKIHDFVQHPDPKTGVPVGYIVMEYVGGQSLRDMLMARRAEGARVMPLAEVLAYGAEVLPALGYLHGRDLLYCDFKPDNVIHAEEQLKLIDLGAVRRIDDDVSAVYGTPGYQAPDVAEVGPSIASDIYTVGRSLAVLSFEFRGFSTTYASSLPERADIPLLAQEESYYRLLRRSIHRDPARRFQSASEMSEQLLGVLREVLSAVDGAPRAALSRQFTPERRAFGTGAGEVGAAAVAADLRPADVAGALPLPQVDVLDPGAGFLATLSSTDPAELVRQLEAPPVRSTEVSLRLVRARIEAGDLDAAGTDLDALTVADPFDWRVDWYRGIAALAAGRPGDARVAFDAVYGELPGEPAARLALAAAIECTGDTAAAEKLYDRVWRVDRGFISAAFGLARIRLAAGDRDGTLAVLDQVPDSSSHHITAQVAAVRASLVADQHSLLAAAGRLERLVLDVERQALLTVEMLKAALDWITGTHLPAHRLPDGVQVLGHPLTERGLRFGLERAYRTMAQFARDPDHKIALVDQANAVRPRTLT
ncbi:serine/threonine-protein kinase [Phytohabitans rumicis]|uniref:non-specific serine/threonine protein kinase n=1 Tax=Phytohabitans rumicis TaxID=1076125 RepID=A0A6V8L6B1_9ACTN|nr:serine/threonine-protein kinase [Phytohabitans rumicis]GFJ90179.1 serine/threonine-protein kinase PknG [Phytohabitans rumicis]